MSVYRLIQLNYMVLALGGIFRMAPTHPWLTLVAAICLPFNWYLLEDMRIAAEDRYR